MNAKSQPQIFQGWPDVTSPNGLVFGKHGPGGNDRFGSWREMAAFGRSYIDSALDMTEYEAKFTKPASTWQRKAYAWAIQNPESAMVLNNRGQTWVVGKRGEYVLFVLPGKSRAWISRDEKNILLVHN